MILSKATSNICKRSLLNLFLIACFAVIPNNGSSMSNNAEDPIFLEAEDAITFEDAKHSTEHEGFTGSGYLDFQKQFGYIEWEIEIETSSMYDIIVRYASSVDRPCDLFVDDLEVPFDFSPSGGWKVWSTETHLVYLNEGFHIFNLVASRSTGPNVDSITLVPYIESPAPTMNPTLDETAEINNDNEQEGDGDTNQVDNDNQNDDGQEDPLGDEKDDEDVVPPPSIVSYNETVILDNNNNLDAGVLLSSPNGKYQFGLDSSTGDLVLLEDGVIIWHADVKGGVKLYLQSDGNLIVRESNNQALWTSNTHGVDNTQLVLDDGGRIAVTQYGNAKWLAGKPRGVYKGPSSPDLVFPIRGAFYYAWYKETWTVNGALVHAEPTLSYYRSDDPDVAEQHIKALDYAHVDLSIVSWWGPEAQLETARITLLLDKTLEMNSDLKWGIYYEDEKDYDYPPEIIKADLDYLKANFAWHPSFGHKDGKPIIFVYNEGGGCEIATRWKEANIDNGWYVVLKLFPNFEDCNDQPDSWHEYGPAVAFTEHRPWSTSISPGFWRADLSTPQLPRIGFDEFRANVIKMVDNGDDWQLLTTFNEHGEGTAMESSEGWESASGFGVYMDILHDVY